MNDFLKTFTNPILFTGRAFIFYTGIDLLVEVLNCVVLQCNCGLIILIAFSPLSVNIIN